MPSRPSTAKPAPSTRDHVLDVAERLAQTRGFNGFSYADIAAELKVTKASLHYHFPTKTDLGCALVQRYGQRFGDALGQISGLSADLECTRDPKRAVMYLLAERFPVDGERRPGVPGLGCRVPVQ